MTKAIDLTGQRFSRLEVLERAGRDSNRNALWLCACDCGALSTVRGYSLRTGATSSCGCYNRERVVEANTTHQMCDTREYAAWRDMIQRCTNPKNKFWDGYGGRGIGVAAEWLASFEAFFAHVGPRLGAGFSLDRINNDGNYEPGNVRWATAKEQANNRRDQ